jgi:N-acetyltransferase
MIFAMSELFTLQNKTVRLEPISAAHIPALLEIARSAPETTYALTSVPPTLEGMTAYVRGALEALEQGSAVPFATVSGVTGEVVGSTRFGNIEHWAWGAGNPLRKTNGSPDAAEIGWTWLAPSAQRTGINTSAKYLMLRHAFETWQVRRMTLKTDARNAQSRNAILRIGAQFDGILRAHVPAADGGIRDSAMFSILASEWEAVKARLEGMIESRG